MYGQSSSINNSRWRDWWVQSFRRSPSFVWYARKTRFGLNNLMLSAYLLSQIEIDFHFLKLRKILYFILTQTFWSLFVLNWLFYFNWNWFRGILHYRNYTFCRFGQCFFSIKSISNYSIENVGFSLFTQAGAAQKPTPLSPQFTIS